MHAVCFLSDLQVTKFLSFLESNRISVCPLVRCSSPKWLIQLGLNIKEFFPKTAMKTLFYSVIVSFFFQG